MARMPASTPTEKISADDWLPGEYVLIKTYQGDRLRGEIMDAMVEVTRHSDGSQSIQYTSNRAARVKLAGHITDWKLFSEVEPGVAGPEIPFTPQNLENLDPTYAEWILGEISKRTAAWTATTTGGDSKAERHDFPEDADAHPEGSAKAARRR